MILHFGKLQVKHLVLIVDKITHSFILGNDFLTEYKCDLLNCAKAIVFGGEHIPYVLFRFTVNSICTIICFTTTTSGPYEKIIPPALLDANAAMQQIRLSCSNQQLRRQALYSKHAL